MTRKLISVLTAMVVLCCSVPLGIYAVETDDSGFDTGVLTFDDITDADGIQSALADYVNQSVFVNANEAATANVVKPIDEEGFGKSIAIENNQGYAGLCVMSRSSDKIIKGDFAVEFSIKKGGAATSFACSLENNSDTQNVISAHPLVFMNNGNIRFCGKDVMGYDENEWYDVRFEFSPKISRAKLSLKKHSENEWNIFAGFAFTSYWTGSEVNLSDGFNKIELGYLGTDKEAACVDNLRYYSASMGNINLISDDFSVMPEIVSYYSATNPAKQWGADNISGKCDLDIKTVDGRQALSIGAVADTYYVTIGKLLSNLDLPDGITCVIKFGIGMSDNAATAGLVTNNGNTAMLSLGSALSGSDSSWSGFENGKIYDFQFVYSSGISRVYLTADNKVYAADTNAVLNRSFDFQFYIPAGGEVYLSSFEFDIVGEGCNAAKQYIKSGYETASLDDTIVFEYDQILSDKSDIVCEVRKKGETDYKICSGEVKFNRIEVKPGIMETAAEYEVRTGGAESITGSAASEADFSFKTSGFDIKSELPKINGDDISVFIQSAYSDGAPVSVIALTADAGGNLLEAADIKVSANSRDGEEYKVTPSFDLPYETLKVFVWDDIISAAAYGPSFKKGGALSAPAAGGNGEEPISEVRLDKNAGKLYISGYNNSDIYKTAVIEVLKDGVVWNEDGSGAKSIADYDASKDSILDYLCYFNQIDNLEKGKPYSVSLNYSGEKIPKIMVRFGRDGAIYYDSELIESVNNAKTGEELKNILMNDDYVKKTVGDIYAQRIKDETTENMFWNIFLEKKNKAYGTDGQFSSMYRIVNALTENINLTLIRCADTTDKMNGTLEILEQDNMLKGNSFDLYFGEGDFSDKSYLSSGSKDMLLKKMIELRNSYETAEAFAGDFAVKTVLYSLCGNDSKYNVCDIILKSDLITKSNISGFTALKKLNQIEVCDKINVSSVPYESIAALEAAIRSYAGEYNGNDPIKPSPGGSGGSGGKGSAGGGGGFQLSTKTNDGKTTDENKAVYSDLSSVLWAKTAIEALSAKGIVSGTGEGKFSPSETVKREEFVKMLMGVIDIKSDDKEVEFSDAAKDAWYWEYVKKAAASGIVLGVNENEFGIGSEITREQMAAMVFRAVRARGFDIPAVSDGAFSDYEKISDYAKEAGDFIFKTGIMNGKSNGIFDPSATATRAEAAKVIYELLIRTEALR